MTPRSTRARIKIEHHDQRARAEALPRADLLGSPPIAVGRSTRRGPPSISDHPRAPDEATKLATEARAEEAWPRWPPPGRGGTTTDPAATEDCEATVADTLELEATFPPRRTGAVEGSVPRARGRWPRRPAVHPSCAHPAWCPPRCGRRVCGLDRRRFDVPYLLRAFSRGDRLPRRAVHST